MRLSLIVGSTFLVTACGTTPTSPNAIQQVEDGFDVEVPGASGVGFSFEELNSLGDEIRERTDFSEVLSGYELPETGQGVYTGTLAIGSIVSDFNLVGLVDIQIQFSHDSLSGELYGIVDQRYGPARQSVSLQNGEIRRDNDVNEDFLVSGQFSGEIEFDEIQDVDIVLNLFGDLYDTGDSLAGIISGTYVISENDKIDFENGVFIAEID